MEPNYPPIDSAPPPIPRGRLWASLLVPPAIVVGGWVLATAVKPHLEKILPGTATLIWNLALLAGITICLIVVIDFIWLMAMRYRGPSLVLLILGYLIGEAVAIYAIAFGAFLYTLRF